jgi:hypothetical protein
MLLSQRTADTTSAFLLSWPRQWSREEEGVRDKRLYQDATEHAEGSHVLMWD